MELFSPEWFGALLSIIAIDLVLAGDNAVVIAMAANSLPPKQQRMAVVLGTMGAIVVRAACAVFAVYLLRVELLKAIGGLLLLWIAWRMVTEDHGKEKSAAAERQPKTMREAMMLIVFADAIMGLDNALAIAAAAKDDIGLVIFGLLLSIPIIMWGSFLVLRIIKKHPWVIWLGGALLGYIGGGLVATDPFFFDRFFTDLPAAVWTMKILPAVAMFALGWWFSRRRTT
ncbi:MAG: TerC family protein [Betaproteobacteria bacterium AqS2]|uniref:TerC family protein n=1 Tax=Candidatus Amphirhobacter heronislandensis TaxID=1732024 RepID=A0A930XXW3_9GAMM|nr:TerC family protein [Betaproteobacteria bacterium AqS2]